MNHDLFIKHKLWISSKTASGIFGDGKYYLLKTIEQTGSLKEAAKIRNISYRKAWGDLKKAESGLGFSLITKIRGGKGGGGSTVLTEKGKTLIDLYSSLKKETSLYIEEMHENFFKNFNNQIKGDKI